MLIAHDKSGKRFYAPDAERRPGYICPQCKERVMIKKGDVIVHHFAHYPGSNCVWWEPESKLHLDMKLLFKKSLESNPNVVKVELEYQIGDLFADVYFETNNGRKIAVECQISDRSLSDMNHKTRHYFHHGVLTWWVISSERIPEQWDAPHHGPVSTLHIKRSFYGLYLTLGNITIYVPGEGFFLCYWFEPINWEGTPNSYARKSRIELLQSKMIIKTHASKSIDIITFTDIERHRENYIRNAHRINNHKNGRR